MFTKTFWTAALERAVKTAAQAVLTTWMVADQALNLLTVDWELTAGLAAGGFAVSLLTSIVSLPFGPGDTPSVTESR